MHTLSLSGIHVTLPCAAAELLICIGGGRAPSPTWFTDLLSAMEKSGITSHILAIDKGVNLCRAVSKPPSLLIGDGDSASPEAWAWAVEHRYIASLWKKTIRIRLFLSELRHSISRAH